MKSPLKSASLVELVVRDGLLELVEGHVHLVHPLPLPRVGGLPPGFGFSTVSRMGFHVNKVDWSRGQSIGCIYSYSIVYVPDGTKVHARH